MGSRACRVNWRVANTLSVCHTELVVLFGSQFVLFWEPIWRLVLLPKALISAERSKSWVCWRLGGVLTRGPGFRLFTQSSQSGPLIDVTLGLKLMCGFGRWRTLEIVLELMSEWQLSISFLSLPFLAQFQSLPNRRKKNMENKPHKSLDIAALQTLILLALLLPVFPKVLVILAFCISALKKREVSASHLGTHRANLMCSSGDLKGEILTQLTDLPGPLAPTWRAHLTQSTELLDDELCVVAAEVGREACYSQSTFFFNHDGHERVGFFLLTVRYFLLVVGLCCLRRVAWPFFTYAWNSVWSFLLTVEDQFGRFYLWFLPVRKLDWSFLLMVSHRKWRRRTRSKRLQL